MKSPKDFEKDFKRKYSRWSDSVWKEITDVHAVKLLDGNSSLSEADSGKVLEAYASLCGEGIGLGYLYPGANNLISFLFLNKIPELLPHIKSPAGQIGTLAEMWNLSETVIKSPAWIEPIFLRKLQDIKHLDEVEKIADSLSVLVNNDHEGDICSEDPAARKLLILSTRHLGFFLPKKLEFTAPPVLTVTGTVPEGLLRINIFAEDGSILSVEKLEKGESLRPSNSAHIPLIKEVDVPLTAEASISNPLIAALIFKESQNIWLWIRNG